MAVCTQFIKSALMELITNAAKYGDKAQFSRSRRQRRSAACYGKEETENDVINSLADRAASLA